MNPMPMFPSGSSPYWLESPFEIRQNLRMIAKRAEKITLWLGLNESFVTVILDITEPGDLIMDASSNAKFNAMACRDVESQVHGMLDRVEIDFGVGKGSLIEYDMGPALLFAVPGRLHKLQRREFFRVPTPMARPLFCSLYLESGGELGKNEREFQAQVLDISGGGLCLQEPRGLELSLGNIYKDCSMLVPDIGVLRFDLTIRHVFKVENRLGKISRHIGCEFLNLTSAGQESIQKFIVKLERDRRAVLG